MEHNPSSEANCFSANQKFPQTLLNPIVHYHIHKCPPPGPILSNIDPIHTLISNFLKIRINIILPSTPGFSKLSLSLQVSHQNPVYTSRLPYTYKVKGNIEKTSCIDRAASEQFDNFVNCRISLSILKFLSTWHVLLTVLSDAAHLYDIVTFIGRGKFRQKHNYNMAKMMLL